MIRVFIGYDPKEAVAYHVLEHSLMRHSTVPLSITPLALCNLNGAYKRQRDPRQSTDFSFSRFLVPYLCDYKGWALFMDCDMLCRADIAEIAQHMNLANWFKAVYVVKHDYVPTSETKFLGNVQSTYGRKNWSSVMLFNNVRCKALTPTYVNVATGLDLHQFRWLPDDDQIGELPKAWNHLVGEYAPNPDAKLAHFTLGTPCFAEYRDCEFADEWRRERELMNGSG